MSKIPNGTRSTLLFDNFKKRNKKLPLTGDDDGHTSFVSTTHVAKPLVVIPQTQQDDNSTEKYELVRS